MTLQALKTYGSLPELPVMKSCFCGFLTLLDGLKQWYTKLYYKHI